MKIILILLTLYVIAYGIYRVHQMHYALVTLQALPNDQTAVRTFLAEFKKFLRTAISLAMIAAFMAITY